MLQELVHINAGRKLALHGGCRSYGQHGTVHDVRFHGSQVITETSADVG